MRDILSSILKMDGNSILWINHEFSLTTFWADKEEAFWSATEKTFLIVHTIVLQAALL